MLPTAPRALPDDEETELLSELKKCFEERLVALREQSTPTRSMLVWPTYQKMTENVERLSLECQNLRRQLFAVRIAKQEARLAKGNCTVCRGLTLALQEILAEHVKVERELYEAAIVREDPIAASEATARAKEFLKACVEVRAKCEIHRLTEHDEGWTADMIPIV